MRGKASGGWSERRIVEQCVKRKLTRLQESILSEAGHKWAASQLAQLRRAVGKYPASTPEIWALEFEGVPSELLGKNEQPSNGEWALHLALTLYAVHQQGQKIGMYRESSYDDNEFYGIGSSVRRLAGKEGDSLAPGQMPSRFSAMVTAETIDEVAHYARQLVQQLRAESIQLDYAAFAGQLYAFQNPYLREGVRLEWGREFARSLNAEQKDQ